MRSVCVFDAGPADKAAVKVKVQDGPALFVCRLSSDGQQFANLDLILDEYTELVCTGAPVHVTGLPSPTAQLSSILCSPSQVRDSNLAADALTDH